MNAGEVVESANPQAINFSLTMLGLRIAPHPLNEAQTWTWVWSNVFVIGRTRFGTHSGAQTASQLRIGSQQNGKSSRHRWIPCQ